MRVNFVLPRSTNTPMGGYKVVFQYANELVRQFNYEVHIYFVINAKMLSFLGAKTWLGGHLKNHESFRSITWYDIDPSVKLHFDVFTNTIENIDKGCIIATHWSTVACVYRAKVNPKNKFYFIQDYEIFDKNVDERTLNETWLLPIKKIVISKWLASKAKELNATPVKIVPNFINLNEFPIAEDGVPTQRDTVSFLWHDNPRKQSDMGIEITRRLHLMFPNFRFVIFGASIPKQSLPSFLTVYTRPSPATLSKEVYGRSLVYFMPSMKEGWGLTGLEAMASGAAVVSINNGGINEYAVNNQSAIIVPNSKEKLFNAIVKVLNNERLRLTLQREGYKVAQSFDMGKQVDLFKKLLTEIGEWDD